MNVGNELVGWLHDTYVMERGLEITLRKISESRHHQLEIRVAATPRTIVIHESAIERWHL